VAVSAGAQGGMSVWRDGRQRPRYASWQTDGRRLARVDGRDAGAFRAAGGDHETGQPDAELDLEQKYY
jgi:hypothetical protein